MTVGQVDQSTQGRRWHRYLSIGIGLLLTVVLAVAIVYFWDDIHNVDSWSYRYGYLGGFLVSIFGGVTIIPLPTLLVIFTLGHLLNPFYIGLVAGLGEAIGGITVYMTGTGGGAVWSKLRPNGQSNSRYDIVTAIQSKLYSKGGAFYNRLAALVGWRGNAWLVFITSAFVWGLYYPAALAAGTLNMGLKRFFLVSWAGKTIRGLIIAFAGYEGLYFLLRWIGG